MDKNDLNKKIQKTIELLIRQGCNRQLNEEIHGSDGSPGLNQILKNIFELRTIYLSFFDQLSIEDITRYSEKINQINGMYGNIREFYRLGELAEWDALEKYRADKLKKREKE